MSIRFTQSSALLFKTSFEETGGTSMLAGVPKLFYHLIDRASTENQIEGVDALMLCDLTLVSSQSSSDTRVAQLEAMLDYAATLSAEERVFAIGLQELLVASFRQLEADIRLKGRLSPQQYHDFLRAASLKLSAADRAERDQTLSVEVSFAVVCSGPNVEDHDNQYESLADAVRAKWHIERRAGLREWPSASENAHQSYVMMLMPGNLESVTDVAIRITS